jgi:uncharacterized membrane protein YdbT with pleckstrin-like domain
MSYIDKNLLPDEKILFRTRKNFIVFRVTAFFLLLTLFFCSNTHYANLINDTIYQFTMSIPYLNKMHRLPAVFFFLLALYSGARQGLLWGTSDYVVTNTRIVMKQGFFDRYVSETRLNTVSHVSVDQSMLGQILNYGTIVINGFGGNQDYFIQVNRPNEFQKAVQSQLSKNFPMK